MALREYPAHRRLPYRNSPTADTAGIIYTASQSTLANFSEPEPPENDPIPALALAASQTADVAKVPGAESAQPPAAKSYTVLPLTKLSGKRSKAHLLFVASHPCLICQRTPCDAHHLKFAQPRALGRKVSDEFTVPLCRD